MFLLLVVVMIIAYEVFKLFNMTSYRDLLDGLKSLKGDSQGVTELYLNNKKYMFITIAEYIYLPVHLYLFFTPMYPVAIYMLVASILMTVISKKIGRVSLGIRYFDAVVTITLLIINYFYFV